MKEVTIFEAEDGKRFESESDCRDYEFQLNNIPHLKNCKGFDFEMRTVLLNEQTNPEDLTFIYVDTEEGFQSVCELFDYLGYIGPRESGLEPVANAFLWYSDEEDQWVNLEQKIHSLQDLLAELKERL